MKKMRMRMTKTTIMTTERQTPTTSETAASMEGWSFFIFQAVGAVLLCDQSSSSAVNSRGDGLAPSPGADTGGQTVETRISRSCPSRNHQFVAAPVSLFVFRVFGSQETQRRGGCWGGWGGGWDRGSWRLSCVTWISAINFGSRCCGVRPRGAVRPFSGAFGRLQADRYLVLS